MSFSFEIKDGDLNLASGSFGTVRGIQKLAQDLGLWLREAYGIDRFHPNYGSTLDSYVGDVVDSLTIMQIEQEVLRVCSVYQQLQVLEVKSNPGRYTSDELLDSVQEIKCTADYDTIYIDLSIRTVMGAVTTLKETISVG